MAILIVDDDPDVRESLAEVLALEGFVARTAQDGFDALQKIEEDPPDIVLLDLLMPRMDGIELMGRLQADPSLSRIPIVLSTSDPTRAPPGAVVVEKPVDVERLLQVVRAARRRAVA